MIAVDQDGHPALVTNKLGSGKTLLSAYPIETYLANSPAVFDKPEPTYRVYQALREESGKKPLFHTDQPSVEVASLSGTSRGYAIVTNHSGMKQSVTITSSQPLHSVSRVGPHEETTIGLSKGSFRIDLDAYDASVFEWK